LSDFGRNCVTITLLLLITGCNQRDNDFIVFADHENLPDESRVSLIKCLNTEGIEYKVDSEENVLIKKKNSELAVSRCS
jgi:hypothetical protein